MANRFWYVTFHGGDDHHALNNIHVYSADGEAIGTALDTRGLPKHVALRELRGFGFGPDGDLYVATGDAGEGELAQDPGSLNGKYLRLTPRQYRGGPSRAEIVSVGNRNAQGFDWEPDSGRMISTEHGPSGFDGPQGFDEINAIRPGANYGWPEVYGSDHGRFTAPLRVYDEAIAPSGATFVTREGSRWTGDFVFAALRGESLHRLRLDGDRVVQDKVLLQGEYGRLRTVREAPDGSLYVLTSNRDGRGSPQDGDDRILRLTPP